MSATTWLPIHYRDFHDVPRLFAVEYERSLYLFDSPFSDDADDYDDDYVVYRLPMDVRKKLDEPSWAELPALGREVGRVPTESVEFDSTKRRLISQSVFRRLVIK